MKVSEYTAQHSPTCFDHARACARATIDHIYSQYHDEECLSDVDIDKLKDALQCLMYIKSLDPDKH